MNHEYDIDEDGSFTMVFVISENRWRGSDEYESDGLTNISTGLFSFKNGELWSHNVRGGDSNVFYGQEVSSYVGLLLNAENGKIKVPAAVSVESNLAPGDISIKSTLPQAETIVKALDFRKRENIYYATIKRSGTGFNRINGERVRGPFIFCLAKFPGTEKLQLRFINIQYALSAGHEFV